MRYQLRQLRGGDIPELIAFHERCSEETHYRRFLAVKPRLLRREAERFCGVDQCRDGAIVACDPHCPRKIRGVGRWSGIDGMTAEVAFVVEDDYQGHGIGRSLVTVVIAHARRAGFTTLIGDVFAANMGMRHVLRTSGCPFAEHPDGSGVFGFSLDLSSPMALAA